MPNASISIDGTEVISKTDGVVSQTFPGPNHTFTVKSVNQPITGANNSTNDDANSDQLAIYNGAMKLWGINENGWVQNPKVPAFYGSNITPATAGSYARVNEVLLNNGNHGVNVNPDGTIRTRFIAPIDGIYFTWMGNIGENVAETTRMHFYINGVSQYAQLRLPTTTDHGPNSSMNGIFEMSAGDYLEWYAFSGYGWYGGIFSHVGCYLLG